MGGIKVSDINNREKCQDGIHAMVPREKMTRGVRLLRDTYAIKPNTPFLQQEFGYYCRERWYEQGLPRDADFAKEFGFDPSGKHGIGELGWCEASFVPAFDEKIIEDRGDHELVQDYAGRHVLFFKGRRSGFMPEYVGHPVKDTKSWEDNCKWRLDPSSSQRYTDLEQKMDAARNAAGEGRMICQKLIGGYMYLRSLIGPTELLYMFCEQPHLIHDCMQTWFALADTVIAKHQQYVTLDELFFAEDICYNNGCLISPDMMLEFLFPYYQQLIHNIKQRQIDQNRHLYIQVDTDGWCEPVIPFYKNAIGLDAMSPFEVASGCDVVEIGKKYPDIAMFGGIDKRVLATGKDAIDKHLDYILPAMYERGGYIPTCDHGVPEEVSLEDYRHYRKRCLEYAAGEDY